MSTEETTRVAVAWFLNITTTASTGVLPDSTTGKAQAVDSSFNFAVIPVVAVVVLVIVLCLKCCQWFRRYTRGSEKDENNQYAFIVCDGDDDFGHIDMLSESASTQYDTVSSFCSFQKRNLNNNNNYQPQFRSSNLENETRFTDTPRHWLLSRLGFSRESSRQRNDTCNEDSESSFSFSSVRQLNTDASRRLSSASSEDMETDPLNTSDASILRRNNKFRVSFVTENTRTAKNRSTVHSPTEYWKKVQISKIETKQTGSQDQGSFQNGVTAVRHIRGSEIRPKPEMVSIATQTNKSFRYSLIKRNRRHMSDSIVGSHFDTADSSNANRSDKIAEPVQNGLIVSACICDNRFYMQQTRPFQDEVITRSIGCDVCDKTKQVFPIEPRVKVYTGKVPVDKDINDTEMADDVFITEPVPDGKCSLIRRRCDGNAKANEYMGTRVTTTTTECTAENCARCNGRHSVVSKNEVVAKMPKSLSDPVDLKQLCVNRVNGDFDPRVELKNNSSYSRETFCDTDDIVEETVIEDAHQSGDDIICDTKYEKMEEHTCNCRKHVCRNCDNSINSSDVLAHKRHNSGRSDTVSASLTSLESSGYFGEMSSDQSE